MAIRLVKSAPQMLRQRQKPRLSRQEMNTWFEWSQQQDITQTSRVRERFIGYLRRQKFAKTLLT